MVTAWAKFLSTPSARRATSTRKSHFWQYADFYPRPPRGGRPVIQMIGVPSSADFYPRPPRGGRRHCGAGRDKQDHFYPRPPRGGRLADIAAVTGNRNDFYPRPPRGGRPRPSRSSPSPTRISIHALREEGDDRGVHQAARPSAISIHALREEGDAALRLLHPRRPISIHALREEGDRARLVQPLPEVNFYPRPPRGGRRRWCRAAPSRSQISIHALREEGDKGGMQNERDDQISIHALREEGDFSISDVSWTFDKFLSTPSARRATLLSTAVQRLC